MVTKDTKEATPKTQPILINGDRRIDMKNGKNVGIVLETPGNALKLAAMCDKPSIMVGGGSGAHHFDKINTVYVELAAQGRAVVIESNGTFYRINKANVSEPVSRDRLQLKEMEEITLTVGKPMPGLYFPEDKVVKRIVAVPSKVYTEAQIQSRTQGLGVDFVQWAEKLVDDADERAQDARSH